MRTASEYLVRQGDDRGREDIVGHAHGTGNPGMLALVIWDAPGSSRFRLGSFAPKRATGHPELLEMPVCFHGGASPSGETVKAEAGHRARPKVSGRDGLGGPRERAERAPHYSVITW